MSLTGVFPYPDEALTSAVLRACRNYLLPMSVIGFHFFANKKWRPKLISIPALAPMEHLFGIDRTELLWNHTVFPFATAFADDKTYERTLETALYGSGANPNGSLLQNAIVSSERWRYCEDCVDADLLRRRESYWRRSHNLPGVWICHEHSKPLFRTGAAMSSLVSGTHLPLPHECDGSPIAVESMRDVLTKISRRASALTRRQPGLPFFSTAERFRSIAVENDWLSADAEVDSKQLWHHIVSSFESRFLDSVALNGEDPSWPSLMLRHGSKVCWSPLKHVILEVALQRRRTESESRLDHRSRGAPQRDPGRFDRVYSEKALAVLKAALKNGEKGITTAAFLNRCGCLGPYRHHADRLPLLRKAVRRFRATKASVKQLRTDAKLFRTRGHE